MFTKQELEIIKEIMLIAFDKEIYPYWDLEDGESEENQLAKKGDKILEKIQKMLDKQN